MRGLRQHHYAVLMPKAMAIANCPTTSAERRRAPARPPPAPVPGGEHRGGPKTGSGRSRIDACDRADDQHHERQRRQNRSGPEIGDRQRHSADRVDQRQRQFRQRKPISAASATVATAIQHELAQQTLRVPPSTLRTATSRARSPDRGGRQIDVIDDRDQQGQQRRRCQASSPPSGQPDRKMVVDQRA